MANVQLSVVQNSPESPAVRAARLFAEARLAGREQTDRLQTTLEHVVSLAAEISEGGAVYPAGVRELCSRLADFASTQSKSIEVILRNAS